jgi:ATP-dependent RNA helicase SUPV3L1/SUV3
MLERLSDLIRTRIAFRSAEGGVAPPTGATGDGGFRVVPELMSVVGCSGEEFSSILKALGFRLERRRLAPPPVAEAQASAPGDAPPVGQEPERPEVQLEAFDEVWRPGKRKEARHDKRPSHKPRREERAREPRRERQRPEAHAQLDAKHEAKRERERKTAVEHSPFAALEALRRTLAARQP